MSSLKLHIIVWFGSLVSVINAACQAPWVSFESSCYLLYNVSSVSPGHTWSDSRLICQRYGGDLLKLDSNNETAFVNGFFNDTRVKFNHYWIGLNDAETEGAFRWADGSNLTITSNWKESVEERNNGAGENKDCVEITYDGKWIDNRCFRLFGFFCERGKDALIPVTPTLPPFPATDKPTTCEVGWKPWRSSCYGFVTRTKTWNDAQDDCQRRYGDLLVINDKDEQDFITDEVAKSNTAYWMGLSDKHSEKRFTWVDGVDLTKTNFTNWKKGEPSNSFGNEDCVEVHGNELPGKWDDNHCSSHQRYICEKKGGVHNCPRGWKLYGANCYKFVAHPVEKRNWAQARQDCLDYNKDWRQRADIAKADLVSITTKAEQDMLQQTFRELGANNTDYWTGLTKQNSTGFYWIDGTYFKYMNWRGASTGNQECVKSNVSYNANQGSWIIASCSQRNNYVCKLPRKGQQWCQNPMGIQSHRIPNEAMTTNSQLFPTTPAAAGRLHLKAAGILDGAWCAKNETKDMYLQIDLGKLQKLAFMSFQGKSNSDAMVLEYYLKYSQDGQTWDTYGYSPPTSRYRFLARPSQRTNRETDLSVRLNIPLVARYIRIYPLKWLIAPCMRVEFYGCEPVADTQRCGLTWVEDKATKNCYQINRRRTTYDSAQEICVNHGGNLASITTLAEQKFISDTVKQYQRLYFRFWIGLNDLDYEGVFKWVDGKPYQLANWNTRSPRENDTLRNCVYMQSKDGYWAETSCTYFNYFICKRHYESPYKPKEAFNNYFYSQADYFWPLDSALNFEGSLPVQSFGNFSQRSFPVNYNKEITRHALEISGTSSYLKVDAEGDICLSHPDFSSCPHGVTLSFVFKSLVAPSQQTSVLNVLIDTMGSAINALGYRVYIDSTKIYTELRSRSRSYKKGAIYDRNDFNHFAFTWSRNDGLKIYIDGMYRAFDRFGEALYESQEPRNPISGIYIGRRANADIYTKFAIRSLAIFKQILSRDKITASYEDEFGSCKSYQFAHGSYCYSFESDEQYWYGARYACRAKGGDLISIHSPVEQAFLSLYVGKYGLNKETFIGLNGQFIRERRQRYYSNSKSFYKWSDRSSIQFTFWDAYAPSKTRWQSCVATSLSGFWKDTCYPRRSYVCKYSRAIQNSASGNEQITNDERTITIYYYQTRTFGCPLGTNIIIKNATYGNNNCYLPNNKTIARIKLNCKYDKCVNIRSRDEFFNTTLSCDKTLESIFFWRARLTVKYTCVPGRQRFNATGCSNGNDSDNPYGVFDDSNICYKLYRQPKTLKEAQKICENDNGSLATVNSRDIQMYLTSLLHTTYKKSDIWIGMKYDGVSQKFVWLDGTAVRYTNWIDKEPNPRNGEYVKVGLEEGARNFLFWKPAYENETLPFFCQKVKANQPTKSPPTTVARTGECAEGWIKYKQNCYIFNKRSLSFNFAEAACQIYGSTCHLVSILSFEENREVFAEFEKRSFIDANTNLTDFIWMGLTNEPFIKGFSWTDGKPLTFVNWYANEPYPMNRHLCAGMNNGGKWQDEPCYLRYPSVCKLPLGVQIRTTLGIPTIPPTAESCNRGWLHFNDSCYYFFSRQLDFHAARGSCGTGAELVSIENEAENKFVSGQMRRLRITEAWIGLTDLNTEGQWLWNDGTITNYLNFDAANNEPDNWQGMEDCVSMQSTGPWEDVACNLKKAYICKKNDRTKSKPVNTTAPPDAGFCDPGWELYGKKCYLFKYGDNENRLKFDDAREYCQQWKDGNLVSIHRNYENAFILSQLYDAHEPMWIGFTNKMKKRSFLWTDQSSVDYTNWYSRRPWWRRFYNRRDCVQFKPEYRYRGRWVDSNCNVEAGFICQKPTNSTETPNLTITDIKPIFDSDSKPCPEGYKKFMRSCYHVNITRLSYEKAVNECRKERGGERGDLVSLHSPYEQAFVFSQFAEYAYRSWIGLRKLEGERNFKWSDGSQYDYTYWRYYVYRYRIYRSDRCATQTFSRYMEGKWNLNDCTRKNPFTCKITRSFDDQHLSFIGNCTKGWSKIKDKCYKLFYTHRTWASAREACKGEGGDLVTITESELQKKLHVFVRKLYRGVWIGLNDRAKELFFGWSSGKPLLPNSYTNWKPKEPQDNSGSNNCVMMIAESGQWDDVPCSRRIPYICEHSLGCNNPLGMVNGTIPDKSINATSYIDRFYPRNARLNKKIGNKDTAWCTNITTGSESLTINLGEVMHITRISTQGMYEWTSRTWGYVKSYMLEYSDDGSDWRQYMRDADYGQWALDLPGNVGSFGVDGTTVDVKAAYLRFTPKLYSKLICLRLELYGCKSQCKRALGMESYRLPNERVKVSTVRNDSKLTNIRPNMHGNYWCAKDEDRTPFVQIDFSSFTKITRITLIATRKKLQYKLLYSNSGRNFTVLETRVGSERTFLTGTHDLEIAITARFIKIVPIKFGTEKVCLQAEFYGCLSDCDKPLGMESGRISDSYITASSALPNNSATAARLNTGKYNNNSWCASKIDKSQYLEVDFKFEAHITEIATQGHNGDIAKYVQKYFVQWSNDMDFWHHITDELRGNADGYDVGRRKLKVPINARYIRINPSVWRNGICMRVEFYGCSLGEDTSLPKKEMKSYSGSMRLMQINFTDALRKESTKQYQELKNSLEMEITDMYTTDESFKAGFDSVTVNSFRQGSVIVDLTITGDSSQDVLQLLLDAIRQGQVGSFVVDSNYTFSHSSGLSKVKNTDSSKGFSRGATIGLSVFAAIVILLAVGASIYYFRSRNGAIQFNHKSFENPVNTDGGRAFENPLHEDEKDNEISTSKRVDSNDYDIPTPDLADSNFKEILPIEFVEVKQKD